MNYLLCSNLCDYKQEMNLVKNKENNIYLKTTEGIVPENSNGMGSKAYKMASASSHKGAGKYQTLIRNNDKY